MNTIDLGAREVNANPDAFARDVLAGDPIRWSDAQRGWLLLSHEAASEGFRDTRLSSDRTRALEKQVRVRGARYQPVSDLLAGWMVFRDPPTHTRLRDPVRRAFTPRVVEQLRSSIDETMDELLGELDGVTGFRFDQAIAGRLPAMIIADLLGVPRTERDRFQHWSDGLSEAVFSVDAPTVDEEAVIAATDEFCSFFGELIEHRRRNPGEDLISRVVMGGAADGESVRSSNQELTALELVGACTLLLFAGHETTTNQLTSSLRTLWDHPGEQARLAAAEVSDFAAADELLRVAGPAKSMVRKVAVPHMRGGHSFEVGQRVYLVILTANRDPAMFEDPERLDLSREPNLHLGFGWGMHLCLGANLARLETAVALRRVYNRFPNIAPDGEPTYWSGNALGRSINSLSVTV